MTMTRLQLMSRSRMAAAPGWFRDNDKPEMVGRGGPPGVRRGEDVALSLQTGTEKHGKGLPWTEKDSG